MNKNHLIKVIWIQTMLHGQNDHDCDDFHQLDQSEK